MEFGLFSESGHRHDTVSAQAYAADLAEIVLADKLGFREAWIAEPNHVRSNTVTHASLMMANAAALTERICFGSAIRQLPLHHPVELVQEANALDQLTQGRYLFGYGGTHLVSHEQLEMRGIDVAHEDTRAMVHESIEVILKCWTSPEPFDFEGRFWRGKDVSILPRPYQQPHPPIAAACSGSPDTIELAARHNFIPLLGRGSDSAEDIRRAGDQYADAASAAGHTPSRKTFHVAHVVYVGETDREARDDVREGLSRLLEERKREGPYLARRVPPGCTLDDLTFDYMTDTGLYWIGAPDTVSRLISDYYDDSGGFGMLLIFAGLPMAAPEKIARSMTLLMEHVAPRLAHLDPDRALATAAPN
jgi:alkanesulfonate monooxygenase SsuD/methylene tetrahydromethanopterin reductase-like flavin-dependent oxidoreductase (luciferase family)